MAAGAVLGCSEGSRAAVRPRPPHDSGPSTRSDKRRVIVFVWDGLRPDSIDPKLTPRLAELRDRAGVDFRNHHAVYPTFTMMNAAAFATGARSGAHGFYGNTTYAPGATGHDAFGNEISFQRPVFTEDYAILSALDRFARARGEPGLLRVPTLFEAAQARGLRTVAIGKSGPAFMQDYRQGGVILDENMVWPREFGVALAAAGLPLPRFTVLQEYPEGALELSEDNGDPTASSGPGVITLSDGLTPDPRADTGSPHELKNAYLMGVFVDYVLPELDPDLSFIWLRDPDGAQHAYGPGSSNALAALRNQDVLLGRLLDALDRLGLRDFTDLLIASDHGHSTVGSDEAVFPQRVLLGAADGQAQVGEVASPAHSGHSVSGEVRSADLLRRSGFDAVYDGMGCLYEPVLSGISGHGEALYPARVFDSCGDAALHTTENFDVPLDPLPSNAIVVAANGGSDYFYVPSGDSDLVRRLVSALQERQQYAAVFVRSLHGAVPGTFPLDAIGLEADGSRSPPTPDVVVSFAWDEDATTAVERPSPGTEQVSSVGLRGMHGSFSPVDVHATLIAAGPRFRVGFRDDYPSSTLDVAPTVAALLGFDLPQAEGRVLDEALRERDVHYEVSPLSVETAPAQLARVCGLDDLDCTRAGPAAVYRGALIGQTLRSLDGERSVVYYDRASVERTPAP